MFYENGNFWISNWLQILKCSNDHIRNMPVIFPLKWSSAFREKCFLKPFSNKSHVLNFVICYMAYPIPDPHESVNFTRDHVMIFHIQFGVNSDCNLYSCTVIWSKCPTLHTSCKTVI